MAVYIATELRTQVIQRANGLCEYCLLHQDDTPFSHQIDHIVALKHGGETDLMNLALACLNCNRHKGSDLTTFDPVTQEITPLFNPREQRWADHFVLQGSYVMGKTAVGRATVRLLRINDPLQLLQRQSLMETGRYPLQGTE
jgi:hypothetical protein